MSEQATETPQEQGQNHEDQESANPQQSQTSTEARIREGAALSNRRKLKLSQVFLTDWEEASAKSLNEGKYDAAFGILNRQSMMGSVLRNLKFLLKYAVSLLATGRMRRCAQVRKELAKAIKENVYISLHGSVAFIEMLHAKGQHFDAILFCLLTVDMFSDPGDNKQTTVVVDKCMSSMREPVLAIMEDDESMKSFVQTYILPVMRDMKDRVLSFQGVDDQFKCVKAAWIIHYIEVCDQDVQSSAEVLKEGVGLMRDTFGNNAMKYQIFGTLLNNLGSTYMRLSEAERAAGTYAEAIDCFKQADDFETESKREKYIRDTERARSRAHAHMSDEIDLIEMMRQAAFEA